MIFIWLAIYVMMGVLITTIVLGVLSDKELEKYSSSIMLIFWFWPLFLISVLGFYIGEKVKKRAK